MAPATETVPQSQTILKSYFLTGSVPTEANYWEWIDTWFWYVSETYSNSMVAANSALLAQQAAASAAAMVSFNLYSQCANPEIVEIINTKGFASNAVQSVGAPCNPGGDINFTNWFSVPLTNRFAFAVVQTPFGNNNISITAQLLTSNYFCIQFHATAPVGVPVLYTNGYYWVTIYQ